MRELERLFEAMQPHWPVRKYVNNTSPPPPHPLSETAVPEKKPEKRSVRRTVQRDDPARTVEMVDADTQRMSSITRFRRLVGTLKLRNARKLVVAVVGGSVLLVGVAMIVLPGPAILVIPVGLAILATEFIWAGRWLKQGQAMFQKKNRQSPAPATTTNKAWHQLPADEVSKLLEVDSSTGLSAEEVRRHKKTGPNRVTAEGDS